MSAARVHRRAVTAVVMLLFIGTGCSSSATAPDVTESFTADSIPLANLAADRGCLDDAGTLRGRARDWYPVQGGGPIGLNGEETESAALDAFVAAATDALRATAPDFTFTAGSEYRNAQSQCVTHRFAVFARGDDEIVVAAWRVESAGDPFWVPNEAPFVEADDNTLVSSGEHLTVVLQVGVDGTTARVSAYGRGARSLVSGWPSTIAPYLSSSVPLGAAPLNAVDLEPVAADVLAQVLNR